MVVRTLVLIVTLVSSSAWSEEPASSEPTRFPVQYRLYEEGRHSTTGAPDGKARIREYISSSKCRTEMLNAMMDQLTPAKNPELAKIFADLAGVNRTGKIVIKEYSLTSGSVYEVSMESADRTTGQLQKESLINKIEIRDNLCQEAIYVANGQKLVLPWNKVRDFQRLHVEGESKVKKHIQEMINYQKEESEAPGTTI